MLCLEDEAQISDGVCMCDTGPLHSTPIKDSSNSSSALATFSRQKMNDFHKTSERSRPGSRQLMSSDCRSRDAPGAPESTADSGFSWRMAVSGCEGSSEQNRTTRSEGGSKGRRESVTKVAKGGVRTEGLGTRSRSLQHLNVCNNSNEKQEFESSGMEFKYSGTTASYIEQDVIDKQRQEIHLLMEELGTRDRELNDLVTSHQYQVKAWEMDRSQMSELQNRLTKYEGELKKSDDQLKSTMKKMAQVNEQREMEAAELLRTKTEMEKLNLRIRENSQYLSEMEIQNENMGTSLRDLVMIRKELERREEALTGKLESKSKELKEKIAELEDAVVHSRTLEVHYEDLKGKQTNQANHLETWKNRYRFTKNENDRLQGELKKKEDSLQKVTLQLNESLQQAIALQKALFTSCEREKCKDEVLESMKKQQKRTMQELANMRQLFDHQGLTLYKLSVKEKDKGHKGQNSRTEETCSEGQTPVKEGSCKEDKDKTKEKQNRNMSSNIDKARHLLAEKTPSKSESLLQKEEVYRRRSASHGGFEVSREESSLRQKGRGERVRTAWSADRANQLQLNPNSCSVGTSPMFNSEADQVQRSTQDKEASGKGPKEQPRRETESRLAEAKIDPNRRVGRVGPKVKGCEPVTSQKAGVKVEHPSFSYSVLQESPPSTRGQGQAGPSSEQMQNETSGVYESSSDVSPLSSPERRFEDDLTPADSEGMCHELKRDISKVGQETLHSSLKDAANTTDPIQPRCEAFMSSGADDEATPPPKCILKKHSTDLAAGVHGRKNPDLSISLDSKTKNFRNRNSDSELEETKASCPEMKTKIPQDFVADSFTKCSRRPVENFQRENVDASSQDVYRGEHMSSLCLQTKDMTKSAHEEQSQSAEKSMSRKPVLKADRSLREKVTKTERVSRNRDGCDSESRVKTRENTLPDSDIFARKKGDSDSFQRGDRDLEHRAANRSEGHGHRVQFDPTDLEQEVSKQKKGKQIVNEEKVGRKFENQEVRGKKDVRVGEGLDSFPSKWKRSGERTSDDKWSVKPGRDVSPPSTKFNAKSSSSSERPARVKGHGSERGSLPECRGIRRTSPECSRHECERETSPVRSKQEQATEVSPHHLKREKANKLSPIHSRRHQMKAIIPGVLKREGARDNDSVHSSLKQGQTRESSPSVHFEDQTHQESPRRSKKDKSGRVPVKSSDQDASAASPCRNVTISSPNFSISVNLDSPNQENTKQASPPGGDVWQGRRSVEQCLEDDLSEYRTAVSSLQSSCCHMFTPMECLMTSTRKSFPDSQYLTRPASCLAEKEKVPLPEDVAVYLARQRPLKSNLYVNNNKSMSDKVQNARCGDSDAGRDTSSGSASQSQRLTPERSFPTVQRSSEKVRSTPRNQVGKDAVLQEAGDLKWKECVLKEDSSSSTINSFRCRKEKEEKTEKAENERMYFYKQMEESETDWGSESVEVMQHKQRQESQPLSKNNNRNTQPFYSTKAPSLFRQLSQIHFCEKTRRYEWASHGHQWCETNTNANCSTHSSQGETTTENDETVEGEEEELMNAETLLQMIEEVGKQKMIIEEHKIYEQERDISAFEVFAESNCNNSNCSSIHPDLGQGGKNGAVPEFSDHRCIMESQEEGLESSVSELKDHDNGTCPRFVNVTFEDNSSLDKFSHHFGNIVRRLEFSDSLLEDSVPGRTGDFNKELGPGPGACMQASPDQGEMHGSHPRLVPSSLSPSGSCSSPANVSASQVDLCFQQTDMPRRQPVACSSQPVACSSQPVACSSQPVACPSQVVVCFNQEETHISQAAEHSCNEQTQGRSSLYELSKFEVPERDIPTHSERGGARTVPIIDNDANIHVPGAQQFNDGDGKLQHWSKLVENGLQSTGSAKRYSESGYEPQNRPVCDPKRVTETEQFVVSGPCLNNRTKCPQTVCADYDLEDAASCSDSVNDVMCSSVLDETDRLPQGRVPGSLREVTSLPEYFQDISTLLVDPEDEVGAEVFFDLASEKGIILQQMCTRKNTEKNFVQSTEEDLQLANALAAQEQYLLSKERQEENFHVQVHPVSSITQQRDGDEIGEKGKLEPPYSEPSIHPEDPHITSDLPANKSASAKHSDTEEVINSHDGKNDEMDHFFVKEKLLSYDLQENSVQGLELMDRPPEIVSPPATSHCPGVSSRLSRWYPDSVEQVSDQFEERLSSFLEDSRAEDAGKDSTMVTPPMSPATKLHRLLLESQQMIHMLEKTSSVPDTKTAMVPSSLSS